MDTDFLLLDAQTIKDLEIFKSDSEGCSLYELCNLCRSVGGAKILKLRMQQPSSNATKIKQTQESVSYILENRHAFKKQASAYASNRVDKYFHEALPIITDENFLGFALGAITIRANHDRYYHRILRGVITTCGLIRTLRHFVTLLDSPRGEVSQYIKEIRELLSREDIKNLPVHEEEAGSWRILRLDQLFRIHERSTINRLLHLIYEIDALVAMTDATSNNNFVIPKIENGPMQVRAEGLVHPFVDDAIANPVSLDQKNRLLFLTGPNMAGKTTYLRAFSTALYLAHLGMGVPATSFHFVPTQRLFSSISLNDDLHSGVSYFRAEALRVKAIAEALAEGLRVIALMDEPFKGTNIKDAFDASLAILNGFAKKKESLFMFSSHLIELSEHLDSNKHIDCRYFEANESEGRLKFDYLLHKGISDQRLGMRVLKEEGIFELLDQEV